MAKRFPKGCRARNDAILKRGDELLQMWRNGSKGYVHDEIMGMPKSVALAILSFMMVSGFPEEAHRMAAHFREVA
jgi:hypothetical protein